MGKSGVLPGGDAPAWTAEEVTPSDSVNLTTWARALWVGSAGNLKVIMAGDATNTPVTFRGVKAGVWMPIQVKRVYATGTSASDIVAVF